jgi:hypothetical protein
VIGQGAESLRDIRAAVDDRQLRRVETIVHEPCQQLARGGDRFGHLHEHAIAGGQRRDHRAHGEVQGVIPRNDDPDDA